MNATYTINEQHKGIEITFSERPGRGTLDSLKTAGFRWHSVRKLWYAKETAERLEIVTGICNGDAPQTSKTAGIKPERHTVGNKYGVKVGDLFYSSWGYEQTNLNFFQVVELVGESSVRVREVIPVVAETESVSWASQDVTIRNTTELLPPIDYPSVFIHDQKKGDLKRLKSYAADGVSHPQFKLDSFADAYKVESDTMKLYESWYA